MRVRAEHTQTADSFSISPPLWFFPVLPLAARSLRRLARASAATPFHLACGVWELDPKGVKLAGDRLNQYPNSMPGDKIERTLGLGLASPGRAMTMPCKGSPLCLKDPTYRLILHERF